MFAISLLIVMFLFFYCISAYLSVSRKLSSKHDCFELFKLKTTLLSYLPMLFHSFFYARTKPNGPQLFTSRPGMSDFKQCVHKSIGTIYSHLISSHNFICAPFHFISPHFAFL